MRLSTIGFVLLALLALPVGGFPGDPPETDESGEPDEVARRYDEAYQLLKAEDYSGAIRNFEAVLRLDPDHAMAYANLAYSNRKLGKFNKAIRQYRRALAIDPDLAEAHEYLARALLALGKIDEAKHHLSILTELDAKLAKALSEEIDRAVSTSAQAGQ